MTLYQHYIVSLYSTAATVFCLAIFVAFQKLKSEIKTPYVLYSLCISIWGSGQALALQETNQALSLFYVRNYCHSGVIFIPIFFIHFVLALLNKVSEKKSFLSFCYVAGALFLILDNSTALMVKDVGMYPPIFNLVYIPGGLHPIMVSFFVFLVAYGNYLLFKGYKDASGQRRSQLKWLCWITIFAYIGGAPNFLLGYRIQLKTLMPFGTYMLPIYVAGTTYAIVRHRLLDIEVVIKKSLIFASLFTIVFGMFVSITVLTQSLIAGGRLLGLAISSIIIIFTVRPLEDLLIRMTDKYLFQKKYDPLQLLKTFSDMVLASVLDQVAIIKMAMDLLVKALGLESFALLLLNKDGNQYVIAGSTGIEDKNIVFSNSSHLVIYFNKTFNSINKAGLDKAISSELVQDFNKIKAEFCIPLVFHKNVVGFIAFGKRKSGNDFTNEDIDILVPLTRDIAIALVYARLYEEVRQKDKLATIGTLVAGIKHEIGNPLSSILTSTQLILKEMETWDSVGMPQKEREEKIKNTLGDVLYESRRIGRITKKFTDFARPGDEGVKEIVNIEDSINGALDILQNELSLRHIQIEKNISRDVPPIFVDKDQIHQIFFNILRNAVQAIEESKKPKEEAKVSIVVNKKTEDKVTVDISDSGCGISEEKKARIFEPFYTTKQKGKGTGLGLAIVRQLVGKNKGDVSFKSQEGRGTTFTLEFPIAKNA